MVFFKGLRGQAAACGALLLVAFNSGAWAYTVNVNVTDATGKAVVDAVVYAEAGGPGVRALPKVLKPAQIAQKDQQFTPLVTVVQAGAVVAFPNHDKLRHQVYSFSPAKVFELKLYSGDAGPPPTVLFDKAGTVVVGCNIHDQMLAYVQVVNTPYFAKTDAAGNVRLDNLPDGKYVLKTWHYAMPEGVLQSQPFAVQGADARMAVKLTLKIAAE